MASSGKLRFDDAIKLLSDKYTVQELHAILADPARLQVEWEQLEIVWVGGREARLQSWYSNLKPDEFEVTSEIDFGYNCIAWSVGSTTNFWWPEGLPSYWPPGIPRSCTIPAFTQFYRSFGFIRCRNGDLEKRVEKIALFTKGGTPTHASRQLPDGRWTSKLGAFEDIRHQRDALSGSGPNEYGQIVRFFKRALPLKGWKLMRRDIRRSIRRVRNAVWRLRRRLK